MISPLQEIKMKRFLFLKRLFEITEGDENIDTNLWELGNELGFTHQETSRIDDYLLGEGLIPHFAFGGVIGIMHKGIIEIETALSKPDEPTEHFPSTNYIHIEHMVGSQIQQGTQQSTQTGSFSSNDIEAIMRLTADLKGALSDLAMDNDTLSVIKADIETIESQIKSPRPKSTIIKECLLSLKTILEGAAGNAIASALVPQIIALLK